MRRFLTHARIDAFGSSVNRVIGPFTPGLNVVFGHNEAGKTTFASFVRGVLFGWDDARGRRNAYKPANAQRSGALIFARRPDVSDNENAGISEHFELYRARNVDGLSGDVDIIEDIDQETYRAVFSLTSDELQTLRNTADITARLLTAGSGTNASPANVLAEVQDRISRFTSRAAGTTNSLVLIAAKQDELRTRIAEAGSEAERFQKEARELAELEPSRSELASRIAAINEEIETLRATRVSVTKCDAELTELNSQIASLSAEETALSKRPCISAILSGISSTDERGLRDRIDELSVELAKRKHKADLAKEHYDSSRAAHDAYVEAEQAREGDNSHVRQRFAQLALSIALPVIFVIAGVLVLQVRVRVYANVSTTIVGVALIVFAAILALGAFVLMFRPNRMATSTQDRANDLRWAMLQDKKRYEACCEDVRSYEHEVETWLLNAGLAAADGSLTRAAQLLDELAECRVEQTALTQRRQAMAVQVAAVKSSHASVLEQRIKLCRSAGLSDEILVDEIDREINRRARQRVELQEESEKVNQRYGELRSELARAKQLHNFDELKLAYQQLKTRQREAEHELACLLVAQHMLEAAIASWEATSQPEVYAQANRLLSLMTRGRWTQISVTDGGQFEVTDGIRPALDSTRMSLATCQQLYLSLRIALLITADNVGKSIPIIADDILVSFDAERREAAAIALAELAKSRQVILLTCHEEVMSALKAADAHTNVVRL